MKATAILTYGQLKLSRLGRANDGGGVGKPGLLGGSRHTHTHTQIRPVCFSSGGDTVTKTLEKFFRVSLICTQVPSSSLFNL